MTENNVMARINGRDLTKEEVQNFINMMGNQGMQFQNEEGLKKVADELVNQELMFLD
ncbi:MAG: peptidylprolyl isomerase, partial [Gallicola sp.]|nr:peptidylprolyl isomerase [Gallicola sp.]